MSKLDSAIVVYGAVDDAVVTARNPAIVALLSSLYPQTQKLSERGWFTQVRQLSESDFTDLDVALTDLADVPLATDDEPGENALTKYDLRRLYYYAGTLDVLRKACSKLDDGDPDKELVRVDAAKLATVRQHIKDEIPDSLATPPAACTSFVRDVKGQYATVLLTDSFDPNVTVEQLKTVLNPKNWPKFSTFFTAMEDLGVDDRGWQQLMEVIGTGTDAGFQLRTPLKFYLGELDDGSVYLNYDMADDAANTPGSDHLVLVDNGYVVATPQAPNAPGQPGVRLCTSKELLISGMSPTAAANLACRLGWADAGDRMFFDVASSPDFSKNTKLDEWENSVARTPAEPAAPRVAAEPPPWRLPAGNRDQIITTAAAAANNLVASTARAFETFYQHWQDGLTPEEIGTIGTELGDELTRAYESMFATAVNAVRPASPANKNAAAEGTPTS